MKLNLQKQSGSVIFITLFSVGIIGIGIASYLTLISQSNLATTRSFAWNSAIAIAEAGVEEALEQLAQTGGSNLTANSWTQSGTNYVKSRTITGGRYTVTISSNAGKFVLQSTGYVPRSDATNEIPRSVMTVVQPRSVNRGFVFKTGVDIAGSVYMDSFNSTNPLYSTNGQYIASKATANVLLASNSGSNSFSLSGNFTLKGVAVTGPGGNVNVGGSASVGDMTWNSNGAQTNHTSDDANFDLPDVDLPLAVRYPPASGMVNGTNYSYVLNGGDFQISSIGSGQTVIVTQSNTTIYVSGAFSPSSFIIQSNASVEIYLATANPSLSAIVNQNNLDTKCMVYGLPSVTSLTLGGFAGGVYAPSADISMTGNATFTGAVAAKSLYLRGNVTFHYDEALLNIGAGGSNRRFFVSSWTEF